MARFLLFFLLGLRLGFEGEEVGFLGFYFTGCCLCFCHAFARFLDDPHNILVIKAHNINFQPLEPINTRLQYLIKLILPHIAIDKDLKHLQTRIKQPHNFPNQLPHLLPLYPRMINPNLKRNQTLQSRQRRYNIRYIFYKIP